MGVETACITFKRHGKEDVFGGLYNGTPPKDRMH